MTGSSPRVRGTLLQCQRLDIRAGIIPACAGNTIAQYADMSATGDHPRVCGEHNLAHVVTDLSQGSSPRVRGTLIDTVDTLANSGIIPACAGNTGQIMTAIGSVGDHPRVCGEHRTGAGSPSRTWGSSPRVRGTHHMAVFAASSPGIIPACAGNTFCAYSSAFLFRDHPRVCGEHH